MVSIQFQRNKRRVEAAPGDADCRLASSPRRPACGRAATIRGGAAQRARTCADAIGAGARGDSRRGFTLLEMLATVALAAIVATVAAVSFAAAHSAARSADVADQVARYDRLAREWSRRFGRPGQLTFDLDQGSLCRGEADGMGYGSGAVGGDGSSPAALHLPPGFHFARLVSARASVTAGRVSLPCSTRGQSPSYAVAIAGPSGETQWALVSGLTGNSRPIQDASEAEDIFKALAGDPGDDAR